MVLQEQGRRYSLEQSLITPTARSSELVDRNWFRNISVKEQGWCDSCSLWLVNIHHASFSSIKSTPSVDPECKVKEVILKYKGPCFNFSISWMVSKAVRQSKSSWPLTELTSQIQPCLGLAEQTGKQNSQIQKSNPESKSSEFTPEK